MSTFILFQTQSIDNVLSNEHYKSSVWQKPRILVISEDLEKFQFFRKKLNFGRKCFFRKNQFSSKTWEEPQGRVFVVHSSYGAHSTGFCRNFSNKTKFLKKLHFCVSAHSIKDLRYIEFFETYVKTRFYPIRLIFFRHFQNFWAILFYFKRKV